MLRAQALHHFTLLRTSGPDADGLRSAILRIDEQELNVFHNSALVPDDADDRTGMHHYCLTMDAESMDDLVAELGEAGLRIVRGPVKRRDGISVFVHDPDGVRVELRIGQ